MIPVVLRLKNFLSYGPNEQVINFEPYSLICLSGKNGHGKSSILDAITWAIWGCARKTTGVAKGDEGLVHLGQKEMVVHLEFISGASRYRIRREVFKSYGKTINRLDVEVYDKNTQQFVTLTDKSIRATQDKIEKLVGVDFVTFVSTSFLRQGQSNEFSKKTPRERKDIIASIIGLKKFDQLAVLANEQSKQLAQEIVQVQFKGEQARILSAQKPEIEELLSQAEKKIIQVEAVLQEGVARYDLFVQKSKKILELIEQKNNLEADIVASEHLEKENKWHVGLAVKKWREMHALRINLPSFDALMQQRSAMVEAIQELQNKKELSYRYNDELVSLKNKKNNLEVSWTHEFELKKSELLRKKNERVVEIKFYEAAQKELFDKKKEKEELLILCRQQISNLIALLANKNEHEQLYDREKALFEKRKAFYHSCVSKKNFALATLAEAQDRSSLIENVSSPACPLCEQLLTLRRKQYLAQQLSRSNYLLTHRLNRISLILKQLEELLKAQKVVLESTGKHCAQIVQCEQDLIRFNQQEVVLAGELATIAEREAQLSQIIRLNTKAIAEHEKELIFLQDELTNKKKNDASFIQITSQILAIEQASSGLLFEPEKMEQALGLLKKIETALLEIQAKAHQFEEMVRQKHAIFSEIAKMRSARILRKEKKILLEQVILQLSDADEVGRVLSDLELERKKNVQIKDQLAHDIGALLERRRRAEEALVFVEQYTQEQNLLHQEKKSYDTLVEAYGKNGIQALLIEEVLPEIEREANLLLSRLTDNQTQIFIESVRDLKSGGMRETLDIQISDAVGVRPYEMFSGGEAFRIDFALRIAVSKLLARRAGTHLQTLFIDEGFGSQDEEGLSLLTQALFSIQQDFEKIIIVSHLERLKDSFPVHIIVEKRSAGSFIQVEERG